MSDRVIKVMRAFSPLHLEKPGGRVSAKTSTRVCMHVRGVVRTDPRVLREASSLRMSGFAVTIVDVEDDLTRSAEEEISGIRVNHLLKPHWHVGERGIMRFARSAEKLFLSTLSLLRVPADIYHAHDINALPASYIAALIKRKPLIFDAHELPLSDHYGSRRFRLWRPLLTLMISRCAGVITVSAPIAYEIQKRYRASNVVLVRNIPTYQKAMRSNRLRQRLGLGSEVRIALYQGNLQAVRGLDPVVLSGAYLERNRVIVFMGKGVGTTLSHFECLIKEYGLEDRVKLLPPVPYTELLDWTASADIGLSVFPLDSDLSIRWCLPNKFFEYMMSGLPILASPLEAVAEIIDAYSVGRIVSSLEPAAIGAAINSMLAEEAALTEMRGNALDAARSVFYWEKESQQLLHLYDEVLSSYPRKG